MKTVANFEKVSEWEDALIPIRATVGSAGYDFYIPLRYKDDIILNPGESTTIPTGIRCKIDEGWVLMLFPRSGLGFKGLRLMNTTGIIDSDYYYADNQGHIMAKIINDGLEPITLKGGDRFVQGLFLNFGIAKEEEVTKERSGGFGSTGTN